MMLLVRDAVTGHSVRVSEVFAARFPDAWVPVDVDAGSAAVVVGDVVEDSGFPVVDDGEGSL